MKESTTSTSTRGKVLCVYSLNMSSLSTDHLHRAPHILPTHDMDTSSWLMCTYMSSKCTTTQHSLPDSFRTSRKYRCRCIRCSMSLSDRRGGPDWANGRTDGRTRRPDEDWLSRRRGRTRNCRRTWRERTKAPFKERYPTCPSTQKPCRKL